MQLHASCRQLVIDLLTRSKVMKKALMFGWKIRGIIRYSFRAGWILATIVLNQGVLLSHLPPPLLFRELMPNVVKLLN